MYWNSGGNSINNDFIQRRAQSQDRLQTVCSPSCHLGDQRIVVLLALGLLPRSSALLLDGPMKVGPLSSQAPMKSGFSAKKP